MKVTRHNGMILSVELTREEIEAAIHQRLKQKYPSELITKLERVSWNADYEDMYGVNFHFIEIKLELNETEEEL